VASKASAPSANNTWIVAVLMAAVIATGVVLWARIAKESQKPPIALTDDAKKYVANLKISDVQMKAAESYMKQTVVEITGKIKNTGDRGVRIVDLNCTFLDAYNQILLKERVSIVREKMGGLAPGEEKAFRLPFDTVPEGWNQAMPGLVIAGIEFQ
jgi:hypothetical protein